MKQNVEIVVAMDKNNVIGKNGELPWKLKADLHHFKELTMGYPVIMGRKTYESIGKALPGRRNIIVTRNAGYKVQNCETVMSPEYVLQITENCEKVFIIGGSEIYKAFLPYVTTIHATIVETQIEGDTFFPNIQNKIVEKEILGNHKKDENNEYSMQFEKWTIQK